MQSVFSDHTQRYKIGDTVLTASIDDPSSIIEHTVYKVGRDTLQLGKTAEDTVYTYQCWPIAARAELERIIEIRMGLKAAYKDSMKLILDLRNRIVRGEL